MPARSVVLALVLVATLVATEQPSAQATPDVPSEAEISTAPVTLDGAILFRVRGVSSLPAEMCARLIEERVRTVADRSLAPSEGLILHREVGVGYETPWRQVEAEGDPDVPKVVPRKDWYTAPAAAPPAGESAEAASDPRNAGRHEAT